MRLAAAAADGAGRADLQLLIDAGAEPATALVAAAAYGCTDAVGVLLEARANVDSRSNEVLFGGRTIGGKGRRGKSREEITRRGRTKVTYFCHPFIHPYISPLRPSEQILTSPSTPSPSLSLLLSAQDGKTALHRAGENGHVETVLALLEGKATVDAHDKVMFVRRFGSHHKNPASQSVPSAVASYRQKDRSESRWLFPGLLKYRPGQEGDSASTFQVLIWSILMMIII